jgi:protein-tyrosine phosphatase
MRQRILLVCTANVCRSPVAQVLWEEQCRQRDRRMLVTSAGLDAQSGLSADPTCVAMMMDRGLDLQAHRSVRLNLDRVADQDLILVMEKRQAQRLCNAVAVLQGRVHLLGRWGDGEISDPHGQEREKYETCVARIDASVSQWLDRLR